MKYIFVISFPILFSYIVFKSLDLDLHLHDNIAAEMILGFGWAAVRCGTEAGPISGSRSPNSRLQAFIVQKTTRETNQKKH